MITNYSYPSFKSKLPPALPKSKNTTFDFWPEFKNLCKKEGKEKELHKLLDRLERNGDNNILALDYKPKNKYDITNYYFLLYKDTENLMIDRNSRSWAKLNLIIQKELFYLLTMRPLVQEKNFLILIWF